MYAAAYAEQGRAGMKSEPSSRHVESPIVPSGNGHAPSRSLEGLHATVPVPPASAPFWRQCRAFVGPALLVGVGYMDPGNWGTDLQAGAGYRYDLLWVVALSSLMAVILQV